MKIALDIDDVLFPWSEYAHAAAEAAGITNGKRITQWAFHDDYGITAEELWTVLFAAYDNGMLLQQPYDGVARELRRLRIMGHTLHLITARGFETNLSDLVRAHTAQWLVAHDIPHDTLTFSKDKGILRADVGLDDSVTNCANMAMAGIAPWLMTRWHNEDDLSVPYPRVKSLAEFVDVLEAAE